MCIRLILSEPCLLVWGLGINVFWGGSNLREVVLVPNRMWGGQGLLGCGVG